MPLLFSIITVTYNARKALERTLQSVGVQTYGEMEYLVIDGGSTDGTMERVARWEAEMADGKACRVQTGGDQRLATGVVGGDGGAADEFL